MLKKTITYTDYDGNTRTEDFYFNLSKAEIAEMQLGVEGGLDKYIEKIVSTQDVKKVMEIFKELILKAYGEKSPDGRRFIKTKENREAFSQTEAYSELFVELACDSEAASNFINGIVPNMPEEQDKPAFMPTAPAISN